MRDFVLRIKTTARSEGWSWVAVWGLIYGAMGLWFLNVLRQAGGF